MRMTTVASGVAVALALTLGSASVSGQSATPDGVKAPSSRTALASGTFAMLSGVKAIPMAPRELDVVKGLSIHFTTPSQNQGHPQVIPNPGWHFVNYKENNLGNGQALPGSGPGYSGLCGAALLSPALTIPGQSLTTGSGGGC